ncbi:hypothetical protein Hamer_G014072, partial [Homarus americanus]
GTMTLAQLLMLNCFVCCREGNSSTLRHGQKRETPLPVYLGLLIHTKTRKKELVDALFKLGLCRSYNRASPHIWEMTAADILRWRKLCALLSLKEDSSLLQPYTILTITQVQLLLSGPFTVLAYLYFSILGLAKLPHSYTNVPPVTLCKKDPAPPKLQKTNKIRLSAHVIGNADRIQIIETKAIREFGTDDSRHWLSRVPVSSNNAGSQCKMNVIIVSNMLKYLPQFWSNIRIKNKKDITLFFMSLQHYLTTPQATLPRNTTGNTTSQHHRQHYLTTIPYNTTSQHHRQKYLTTLPRNTTSQHHRQHYLTTIP